MLINSMKTGLRNGLHCCWSLIKIMVPIYVCITFVKYSLLMDLIVTGFSPIMRIFHLPGEAAVPWITGLFSDEYGAIAAIKAVALSGFDITILSIMVMFAHSLFVEAAIIKKMGLSLTFFTGYRLAAAVLAGIGFGLLKGVLL